MELRKGHEYQLAIVDHLRGGLPVQPYKRNQGNLNIDWIFDDVKEPLIIS